MEGKESKGPLRGWVGWRVEGGVVCLFGMALLRATALAGDISCLATIFLRPRRKKACVRKDARRVVPSPLLWRSGCGFPLAQSGVSLWLDAFSSRGEVQPANPPKA